jgi:hypothetical protein
MRLFLGMHAHGVDRTAFGVAAEAEGWQKKIPQERRSNSAPLLREKEKPRGAYLRSSTISSTAHYLLIFSGCLSPLGRSIRGPMPGPARRSR